MPFTSLAFRFGTSGHQVVSDKKCGMASEKTTEQKAKEAAEQLLPDIRSTIGAVTNLLSTFAGPDADKHEISLELTFLALHAYDRLCHQCMPPNMRAAFVDTLVYSFGDSHSKVFVDEQQADFREYFLKKLDERQIYYGKAGDLFAGRGRHSVVRMFAEMMNSFSPNMDVVATADAARELCLAVRGSLIGPLPTSAKSFSAERIRTMMWPAFWILVGITLVFSIISLRLAGTISALVAAAGLFVGLYGKRASREPDVDPRLAAFEVVFATNFIHLALWMALVSVCIWAVVFAKGS